MILPSTLFQTVLKHAPLYSSGTMMINDSQNFILRSLAISYIHSFKSQEQ